MTFQSAVGMAKPVTAANQPLVDYIASNLRVEYKRQDSQSDHMIVLTNSGCLDIPANTAWTIYFNHVDGFSGTESPSFISQNLAIRHVDAWFYALEPVISITGPSSFTGLAPHTSLTLSAKASLKSTSYAFPRWYIVGGPDTKPRIIQNTNSETLDFVDSFGDDQSASRYNQHQDISMIAVDEGTLYAKPILPTPLHFEPPPVAALAPAAQRVEINANWSVVYSGELANEANFIAGKLGLSAYNVAIKDINYIRLQIEDVCEQFTNFNSSSLLSLDEAYVMRVLAVGSVTISGQSPAGVFYGIQSLLALLELTDNDVSPAGSSRWMLPVVTVIDAPRFSYRGLMLDMSRNFIDLETVLRIIDVMSMYKMNKLHLHLTDDQGWRLEIPGLPELTEVGARRGHVTAEHTDRLFPYLGSGPFVDNPAGTGFYSVADYCTILLHASQHHVVVIPEIDLPGHAHAAIQSMRVRRQRLQQQQREGAKVVDAEHYALDDPNDTSIYFAVGLQRDTVVNPCMDSTLHFVEHVMSALVDMHRDIQPLTVIHLGGDEVPVGCLIDSPICQQAIDRHPEIRNRFKLHFMEHAFEVATRLGIHVQAWVDGLMDARAEPVSLSSLNVLTAYGQAWNNVSSNGQAHAAFAFANAGFKVILSHASHLYLDHPAESNRDEPGLSWATNSADTKKAFSYLPAGMHLKGQSEEVVERVCKMYGMSSLCNLTRPDNITGIETCLWSELVRTSECTEYMLLPRLLAVAERAWHIADWETADSNADFNAELERDWQRFSAAIALREMRRLDRMGLRYRLAPPGVIVHEGFVHVSTEFPGQPVQFSVDDGQSWSNLTSPAAMDQSTSPERSTYFVTCSPDGHRRSRPVVIKGLCHMTTGTSG